MNESIPAPSPSPKQGSCLGSTLVSAGITLGLNGLLLAAAVASDDHLEQFAMMLVAIPLNLVLLGVLLLGTLLVKRGMNGGSIGPYVLVSGWLPVAVGLLNVLIISQLPGKGGC